MAPKPDPSNRTQIQVFDGDAETLAASLDRIQHTAADIIKAIQGSEEHVSAA